MFLLRSFARFIRRSAVVPDTPPDSPVVAEILALAAALAALDPGLARRRAIAVAADPIRCRCDDCRSFHRRVVCRLWYGARLTDAQALWEGGGRE